MEGRLRFFFGQINFFSYVDTHPNKYFHHKKNFLGDTDILTYGNDIYFQK
jgi:hypothetical protein